jgi:hypothetical protein
MPEEGYTLNLRTEEAQKLIQEAEYAAVNEALAATVEDARSMCPRSEHPRHATHNADTITKRLRRTDAGLKGTVFTESGYGGFIERGTANMAAHAYVYPAAIKHLPEIGLRLRVKLTAISR